MIDDKQREHTAHSMALRSFARTIGIAEEIAMETYERELQTLTADAKVTRFVGIIAERRTKSALLDLRDVLSTPAQLATRPNAFATPQRADGPSSQSVPRHAAGVEAHA